MCAVDRLDLDIEPDGGFGALGRNGAGKTILIKTLTTLLLPSAGPATLGGSDVVLQATQVGRVIAYVRKRCRPTAS